MHFFQSHASDSKQIMVFYAQQSYCCPYCLAQGDRPLYCCISRLGVGSGGVGHTPSPRDLDSEETQVIQPDQSPVPQLSPLGEDERLSASSLDLLPERSPRPSDLDRCWQCLLHGRPSFGGCRRCQDEGALREFDCFGQGGEDRRDSSAPPSPSLGSMAPHPHGSSEQESSSEASFGFAPLASESSGYASGSSLSSQGLPLRRSNRWSRQDYIRSVALARASGRVVAPPGQGLRRRVSVQAIRRCHIRYSTVYRRSYLLVNHRANQRRLCDIYQISVMSQAVPATPPRDFLE